MRGSATRQVLGPGVVAALLSLGAGPAEEPPARRPSEERGAPPEMIRLAVMAGDWKVSVEAPGPDGRMAPAFETASRITRRLGGALLEESLSLPQGDGRTINLLCLWTWDRFRGLYRMAYADDTFALFDFFEGAERDGRIVLTNLRADTSLPQKGGRWVHGRTTLSDLSQTGFTILSEVSEDGGVTWSASLRGRYRRPD